MQKQLFFLSLFFLLLMSNMCFSQERYHLINSQIIREVREDPGNPAPSKFDVIGYPPDKETKSVWDSLIKAISTPQNSKILDGIILRSAKIQAIYSTHIGNKKIIFYDKNFFSQFQGISFIDVHYLMLFSFMHELGHFIHGDVSNNTRTKESENQADMYACGLLCDIKKASTEKIQGVILSLDGATGSTFYYSKGDRLKNIKKFFDNGLCALSPAVYFDYDSSVLLSSSYKSLDALSADLRANPRNIKIVGYYYGGGSTAYDLKISTDRARGIGNYLINSGVDSKLIKMIGRGHQNPVADNSTEEGRILNRRVEFLENKE